MKSRTYNTKLGKKTLFCCHRSGIHKSKAKGLRAPKSQGTCKMGANCPAEIDVLEEKDSLKVNYIFTHVGHSNDVQHLHISKNLKNEIAGNFFNSINFYFI